MTSRRQEIGAHVLGDAVLAIVAIAAAFVACATGEDTSARPTGRGGSTGLGGETVTGTGGMTGGGPASAGSSGGTSGGGGSSGAGGSADAGAPSGTGGSSGVGGTSGAGGATGTGSSTGSGGAPGSGGRGGSSGTGGGPPVSTTLPYSENFDDGIANGWMAGFDDEMAALGKWAVLPDGTGMVYESQMATDDPTWAVGGDYRWTDVHLETKLKFLSGSAEGLVMIIVRFSSFRTYVFLEVRTNQVKIRVKDNGTTTDVGAYKFPTALVEGTWYTFGVSAAGTALTAYFNGTQVITGQNPGPTTVTMGGIALTTTDSVVAFDDLTVTAP